jgi:hypothetical protein
MKRNNDVGHAVFSTLDAYIAGFLTLRGFIPELIEEGRKIVFTFESSKELNKAIDEYNGGATVEALRLAFAIKTLKSKIFSMRKNNGIYYGHKEKEE